MKSIQDIVRNALDERNMSNTDLAISVTSWLIGVSVGFTVNAVLQQNVETENKRQHLELAVGSAALGWVTKEIVREKAEKRMRAWIAEIKEAKADIDAEREAKQTKG